MQHRRAVRIEDTLRMAGGARCIDDRAGALARLARPRREALKPGRPVQRARRCSLLWSNAVGGGDLRRRLHRQHLDARRDC